MRDLTKSLTTFTWAMSVFGVQQMVSLMGGASRGQGDHCAESFNNVSKAAADTLGSSLRAVYNAGDRLQAGFVDTLFGGFMTAGMDPNRWMRMGMNSMRQGGMASGMGQSGGCCGGGSGPSGARR